MAEKGRRVRLRSGLQRLDRWSATAGQVDKNAAYKALFAVSDGSVFRKYKILGDVNRALGFFVVVRRDLVIKIRRHLDAFGIEYIGTPREAPDQDRGGATESAEAQGAPSPEQGDRLP